MLTSSFSAVAANVLQLGEVAEIEAQMFSFAQKFNRRTAVEFSTNPPFCQTAVRRCLLISAILFGEEIQEI